MAAKISVQELIQAYTESLGREAAHNLIHRSLNKQGLGHLQQLNHSEMVKLCEELRGCGGFIAVLADILLARSNLRS